MFLRIMRDVASSSAIIIFIKASLLRTKDLFQFLKFCLDHIKHFYGLSHIARSAGHLCFLRDLLQAEGADISKRALERVGLPLSHRCIPAADRFLEGTDLSGNVLQK